MLTFFRRGITAKLMLVLLGIVLIAIVITGFGTGGSGIDQLGGLRGSGVATVDGESISTDDVTGEANQALDFVRQQQPELDMAGFVRQGGLDGVVDRLIAYSASMAFGEEHGLAATREMIDRQIAAIPAFHDLTGKFDDARFRQVLNDQKISERQLRERIARQLMQRQLLLPAGGSAMVPTEIATRYASLLLESRSGSVGAVPISAIPAGAAPTEAEIAAAYQRNIARYTVPERRVIRYALFGSDQLGAAAKATDAEIAEAYRAKSATYAARENRNLQQVVLPTEAAARAFAQKLASGTAFEQAAQQAGFAAGDISLGEQSRDAFARLTSPQVAAAAFTAAKGATTQPVRSSFGWHIVRVTDIKSIPGRPLEAVRGELVAEIEQRKGQDALADLAARIEEAISGGASFDEVVRANKLAATETPPLTSSGTAPNVAGFTLSDDLKPMLQPAFALNPDDAPTVETITPNQRFAIVSIARVVPAAAPPLAQIRDPVSKDLVAERALARARTVANAVLAKINGGMPPARAFAEAGLRLPAVQPISATRREIAMQQGRAPAAMTVLFTLARGKAQLLPAPGGTGWMIVHLDRVVPGDTGKDPTMIRGVQDQFGAVFSNEYEMQFSNAIRAGLKVKRNEKAIAELKAQLTRGTAQ